MVSVVSECSCCLPQTQHVSGLPQVVEAITLSKVAFLRGCAREQDSAWGSGQAEKHWGGWMLCSRAFASSFFPVLQSKGGFEQWVCAVTDCAVCVMRLLFCLSLQESQSWCPERTHFQPCFRDDPEHISCLLRSLRPWFFTSCCSSSEP